MLDELLHRMRGYSPLSLQIDKHYPEAAVLVPITRSDEPEVVLTLRASGLSTHSGEVAFPGGRRDPEDADLVQTALREAEEEIGLPPGLVDRPKVGFGAPVRRWIRHDLRELVGDLVGEATVQRRGIFCPSAVGRLVRDTNSGVVDGAYAVLGLMCVELWLRRFGVDP